MEELWKDVEGYNGKYSVSNLGRVRANPTIIHRKKVGSYRRSSYIKKQTLMNKGYFVVTMSTDDNSKRCLVHRLVALAFIPNPENKPQVNHIDGNKQNNCVSNLEWVTDKENMTHASKNGLLNIHEPLNKRPVLMFDLKGNFIKEYESRASVARDLHTDPSCVYNVVRGKFKQTNGYILKNKK